MGRCIPRLYAAASLKQRSDHNHPPALVLYSAALCRGLIEARRAEPGRAILSRGIPRLYAAASLKPSSVTVWPRVSASVFRGFMPRPH